MCKEIVYTKDNCISCNNCVSGCPVPGANIAKIVEDKNFIVVNPSKCIHCGHCITMCRQFSREYVDDTDNFFEDLTKGIPISIIVDPSFYIDFPEVAPAFLTYLKKIGVKKVYNGSIGYDIATWAYCKWLKDNPNENAIAGTCFAVIEYLQKQQPAFVDKIIPVKPPLMCAATYIRKYLSDLKNIAYLSPCITAKDFIDCDDFKGLVQYNVTFKHLFAKVNFDDVVNQNKIAAKSFKPDLPDFEHGSLCCMPGGLRQNISRLIGYKRPIMNLSNTIYMYPMMPRYVPVINDKNNSFIVEALNCEHGCTFGSGVDFGRADMKTVLEEYKKYICKENPSLPDNKLLDALNEHFKSLEYNDFQYRYVEEYEQPFMIPQEAYEEIFMTMHKTTEKSRHVDCESCGYHSCMEMAEAIANGFNKVENCVNYEKNQNQKLLTTNIVTDLKNSTMFREKLSELIAEKQLQGKTVLHFNLKNFIMINKRFDFQTGNKVLKQFGEYAEKLLVKEESLYHSGDDNFLAILKSERTNKVIHELNNLNLPLLKSTAEDSLMLKIRCGVYNLLGTENTVEEIEEPLNVAYMKAKQENNADIITFKTSLASEIENSLEVTQKLPLAMKKEELFLMFQPKVKASKNMLVGAEALIRWNHNGKIIPPSDFISVCEENGFIKRIDFYVLNQVCKKISEWQKKGYGTVRVSVNFSKLHFSEPDVSERILNVINSWHIPHELVEIEFTETSFLNEKENLKKTIDDLKKQNIISSIDDFGTGYSSISLLHDLNFSVLKFDKSFIDSVVPETKAELVVKDIIRMAKDLNMQVVAEGVETKEKLKLVESLGGDIIQGFYFDKPLLAKDFEKRLMQKKYK
ncbi:MAG: EAL domain-containing protein [Treponema sp.]